MKSIRIPSMVVVCTVFSVFELIGGVVGLPIQNISNASVLRLKAGDITLKDRTPAIRLNSKKLAFDLLDEEKNLFVLQFNSQIPRNMDIKLTKLQIEVVRYLPDFAYLVHATPTAVLNAREQFSSIATLSEFSPHWKLGDSLFDPNENKQRVFIKLISNDYMDQAALEIDRIARAKAYRVSDGLMVANLRPAEIQELVLTSWVEWVEGVPVLETFTLAFNDVVPLADTAVVTGHESGTKLMKFDSAWERGFDGSGQLGAIGDTGVDTGDLNNIHSDLNGNLVGGVALGNGSKSWEDMNGHGTHVAGSVVGNGNLSEGAIRGGAYRAKLFAVGLWSPLWNGLVFNPSFDRVFGDAYKAGAKVHSNSWGSAANLGAYDVMASQVDEFMFKTPDFLALFAAGNSGVDADKNGFIDLGSVCSPGTAKNVLTVGASENLLLEGGRQVPHRDMRDGTKNWGAEPIASDKLSNSTTGLAAFSSRGPTRDGRIKPEVVASGTNIVSLQSRHPSASKLWGSYNEFYAYAGGTSMATPLTAGAALVVRQYLQTEKKISNPSGALIKAVMMHTAEDLFPGQYGLVSGVQEIPVQRPNVQEGFGRVDVKSATQLGSESIWVDSVTGVGTGEKAEFDIELTSQNVLTATLSYTDAAGAPSAARALVNDLDLEIVKPDGTLMTLNDRVNNSEYLTLSADRSADKKGSLAGVYKVRVKGIQVPKGKQGKQPYALIVSAK